MTTNEPETLRLENCLLERLSDEEFDNFCFHHFREVQRHFSGGMGKGAKVLRLIEYCDNRERLEDLRQLLQKKRPGCFQGRDASARPDEKGRGSFMNKKTMLELFGVIAGVVTIVAFVISIVDFGDFAYQVRVLDTDGAPIEGAKVTIMVADLAPLDRYTDSTGFTRLTIDASRVDEEGKLIVEKDGYKRHSQEIDLRRGKLPDDIRLERIP